MTNAHPAARLAGLVLAGTVALGPTVANAAPPSKIVVLSKGKGKKRKLRFRPKTGAVQTLRLVSGQQLAMSINGMKMPSQPLPQTSIAMRLEVERVAKGRITSSFKTSDVEVKDTPGVPPAIVQQMRSQLGEMTALGGTMIADTRGQVISGDINGAEALPPEMQNTARSLEDNLTQLVVPLPKEAVGVGAKWRVEQRLERMRIPVTQESTVTLLAINGDVLTLKADLVQRVGAGPVQMPGMPMGASARTKPSESRGASTLTVDLRRLSAVGQINMDISFTIEMEKAGQKQEMSMDMKLDLQIADALTP